MKTINQFIEQIDQFKVALKNNESMNDISKCKGIINDLSMKIEAFVESNNNTLSNEEIKALTALKNSFLIKSNNYSLNSELALKEEMIQKSLKEKYLANKKPSVNDEDDIKKNAMESSKMVGKDFEVVTQDQVILIEIGKICDRLIKGFNEEYSTENSNEDELVNKMKTMESFYVYDVQKQSQDEKMRVMKYIDTINEIKAKGELLKKTTCVIDIKLIKKLEEEIKTIQAEINKTEEKNNNLVSIMKRKNIIPKQIEGR